MPRGARIVGNPRLQVAGLANVQHLRLRIEHPVNPRRAIQSFQIGLNNAETYGCVIWLLVCVLHGCAALLGASIPCHGCYDICMGAREKLSTNSVDKSAENILGGANYPCFWPLSPICLFFRHIVKVLIWLERLLQFGEVPY